MKRLVATWLTEVPVPTPFITSPCGEELGEGLGLQLLLGDDGHRSSNVGGMAEGELTAGYPHVTAFLGSKGALLVYSGYFQGMHLLPLVCHTLEGLN